MMAVMKQYHDDQAPTLRELYPHFDEDQLKTAEESLDRYLEIALRIYDRICLDPARYAEFEEKLRSLTDLEKDGGMEERSNIKNR